VDGAEVAGVVADLNLDRALHGAVADFLPDAFRQALNVEQKTLIVAARIARDHISTTW
jgi:hypothetical protein